MLRASLIFALSFMFATAACASDWHYFGDTPGRHETSMFYDADSIQRPTLETVRVWVKGIPEKKLFRYNASSQIEQEAAHKIAAGYVPGFMLLPGISHQLINHGTNLLEATANLTVWEILADNEDVQPVVGEYWEIDCRGKRLKMLTFIKYGPKDTVETMQNFRTPRYGYIPPDSTAQSLSEMVCPKQ